MIHNCYDVFVIFFPVLCSVFRLWRRVFFQSFSQMIRCNTNIVRGELIDGFCVNNWLWQSLNFQLTKLNCTASFNTDDIVPKISRYKGNK